MAFQNHPLLIEFGELECCAFEQIFLARQGSLTEEEHFLLGIFVKTVKLGFIPTDEMRSAYLDICRKEMERLAFQGSGNDRGFFCGHTKEEHMTGLQKACNVLLEKESVN